MNGELIWVLSLLAVAIVLFATGRVRMDAVALFVIVAFALSGTLTVPDDAPRDKCTLSCAINGIHAAFHYLKKNYISGCVMTVPTG